MSICSMICELQICTKSKSNNSYTLRKRMCLKSTEEFFNIQGMLLTMAAAFSFLLSDFCFSQWFLDSVTVTESEQYSAQFFLCFVCNKRKKKKKKTPRECVAGVLSS